MISDKDFFDRVETVSRAVKTPITIIKNPIDGELKCFFGGEFKAPDVKTSDYLISHNHKDITYIVNAQWYSVCNQSNIFDVGVFENKMTELVPENFECSRTEFIRLI